MINAAVQVTMFLINGVMLQGRVAAYDLFCILLEREGYVQLAYKHAVSTIQPVTPVDLQGDGDGEHQGVLLLAARAGDDELRRLRGLRFRGRGRARRRESGEKDCEWRGMHPDTLCCTCTRHHPRSM